MGIWYHLGFDLDSPRQYCSKFVHEVYRDAMGISLGKVETFRELLDANPGSPLSFWKMWFLGRIPWDRRTVTPASMLASELLHTVYEVPAMATEHAAIAAVNA